MPVLLQEIAAALPASAEGARDVQSHRYAGFDDGDDEDETAPDVLDDEDEVAQQISAASLVLPSQVVTALFIDLPGAQGRPRRLW